MRVRDVMDRSLLQVGLDASVREAAGILAERTGSAVLVVADDGTVVGTVTEAVLANALSAIVEEYGEGSRVRRRTRPHAHAVARPPFRRDARRPALSARTIDAGR